jgi:3-keto-L-gulonate-6-phosphate decarboxylase
MKKTLLRKTNFFISYATADEPWAEWIAWELEEAGHSTKLQAWDFQPGSNFVVEMHKNINECERMIIVLSDHFLESKYTQAEWAAFFVGDPAGETRSILPIRVSEVMPTGLLKSIVYADIYGLSEEQARERLLKFASTNLDGKQQRLKPSKHPLFPAKQVPMRPEFPKHEPHTHSLEKVGEKRSFDKEGANKNIKSAYVELLNLCSPIDPLLFRTTLRVRLLQVALDVSELSKAVEIANTAARFHSFIVEVGDPLIKRYGMEAVRQIRKIQPKFPLVVEMASSDWAEEQVSLAAEAGADIVLLMGLSNETRIEKAVYSARKNEVGLILELPPKQGIAKWCRTAEEFGVDGIAILRNIDSSGKPSDSLSRLRAARKETNIPIAVSGGFTPTQIENMINDDWNVVIVGRAIVDAPDPKEIMRQILEILDKRTK